MTGWASTSSSFSSAIVEFLEDLSGGPLPLRVRAWDGSEAGPSDGVVVLLRSPDAVRYLLWSPGELGVARAYVTGALDVEGDLEAGLSRMFSAMGHRRLRLSPARAARGVKLIAAMGALGRPLPAPRSEAHLRGRLHSPRRDAQVVSHHYDISNEFYSLLLDPSMAYSCGYWAGDRPDYGLADYGLADHGLADHGLADHGLADHGLAEAQRAKLDLICRKLGLRPGARLLDIGCGWGSLTVHAAREYGAEVTAVTVAGQQEAFVRARLAEAGVGHLVDLRHCDYREVLASPGARFDAVAAVEMGEHVGDPNYPAFLSGLHGSLREGGRFLLQVMSRGQRHPGGGPFIERYIAPDMHMRPLAATLGFIQAAGFEVRDVHAMREHYARTIRAWAGQLDARWEEAVRLLGEERARVWRLYLAGGALSFEENRMGVDQILCVRTGAGGRSGMDPTRAGWEGAPAAGAGTGAAGVAAGAAAAREAAREAAARAVAGR